MSKKTILNLIITSIFIFSLSSCDKPAGPGGKATIKGRVFAIDKDNQQVYTISTGYSAGERVYIIYGDNKAIGNDVRTSTDGSFEFRHLNKGEYQIFVNSLDTSYFNKGNDTERPVIKKVKISKADEVITLEDFIIAK